LDIKDGNDAVFLQRLLSKADIFIQNLAPGAAARSGFGSSVLRKKFPRLITCDISGYGETGVYADMKAYDLLVQAETGLCSITGGPDGPGRVGVSACDIAAGLNAYAGILEGLLAREQSGVGVGVQVSLFAGMADWMNVPYLYQVHAGQSLGRHGLHHPSIAPYGAYPAADGKKVLVSIQNEREWAKFCTDILQNAELLKEVRFSTPFGRGKNRVELDELVCASFARWPRAELLTRLQDAGIACGSLNEVEELVDHPQLQTVGYDAPNGSVTVIAPPVEFTDGARRYRPVPSLGEHSEAIRLEFEEAMA